MVCKEGAYCNIIENKYVKDLADMLLFIIIIITTIIINYCN
jgi:hypothetical protein